MQRAVDTEDAAIKCHELAPELFSWRKYKEQINLELVRVCLSDAKKKKNGSLVSGSGREGWRLTSRGLDWFRAQGERVTSAKKGLLRQVSTAGSIDSVRRQRERARIEQSAAWAAWTTRKPITPELARAVLRIDDYTTDRMLEIKIARLRGMFQEDSEVTRFLEVLAQQGRACLLKRG